MRKFGAFLLALLVGVWVGSRMSAKQIKVDVVRYVRVPIEVQAVNTNGY